MMQRMLMATVAGEAADSTFTFFHEFDSKPDSTRLDQFCIAISDNRLSLPIIYFSEWVDRWLMGDQVPGPHAKQGTRYQASCMNPSAAVSWAEKLGDQYQENLSFAARLREAAHGWGTATDRYAIVSIREVMDGSTSDEEVEVSLKGLPSWWPVGTIIP